MAHITFWTLPELRRPHTVSIVSLSPNNHGMPHQSSTDTNNDIDGLDGHFNGKK
ncbi:hypothetical protein GCM10023116_33850 [Kistimonas scapharcae]|uniref:Uncharacterized protein n=1 Tax=Kistimonas scapharcae TaxID=1036133 RepID=A0ABP8V5E6_9GAMM